MVGVVDENERYGAELVVGVVDENERYIGGRGEKGDVGEMTW